MYNESFLFKADGRNEIIVNDGSSFTRDIFDGASKIISSYHKMETHPSYIVCPNTYEEDAFQTEERTSFRYSDWLLVALEVDENFEPRQALLMNKFRQEEGFVFDFILEKVIVAFFRYFSIKETFDSPILSQKDFMESINLGVERRETASYLDFDEDDEEEEGNYFDDHPLPKPLFVPNRKTFIPNFGGSGEALVQETDEEEEELHIEVAKPTFVAGKNKKPLNLNALDRDERYEKKKARERKIAEEEESQDLHIDVAKPAFVSYSNKKPRNLDAKPDRPKKVPVNPTEELKSEPKIEEIKLVKPTFTPTKQGAIKNLVDEKPIKEEEVEIKATPEVESAKEEVKMVVAAPLNNYKQEPSFNLRPDVRHKEASLINNPDDSYSFSSCAILYERIKEIKTLRVSVNCLFVPEILPRDSEIFSLAKEFKGEDWLLLSYIHDAEEKPLFALLGNKSIENLAILVSFRHRDPRIVVISAKGISLNDPAYPFYSYKSLVSIVKGENPYK